MSTSKQNLIEAIARIIEQGRLSVFDGGPEIREYEKAFSNLHNGLTAIALNSGTSSLHCGLGALGVEAGDEVIIPANAYISAAIAVLQWNAVPVLADVEPGTSLLDISSVSERITSRTKAIVAVHLYGQPVDMPNLMNLADSYNLRVLEDCAQAIGASINGKPVGTFGHAAAFSTGGDKFVNTGEGGMLLVDSRDTEKIVRRYSHKGKDVGWWDYAHIGFNYALTEIQAAMGSASLEKLEEEILTRNRVAAVFAEALRPVNVSSPIARKGFKSVPYRFPFVIQDDRIASLFSQDCVSQEPDVRRSYPLISSLKWFSKKEYSAWSLTDSGRRIVYDPADTPVARDLANHLFSLRTGPGVSISYASALASTVCDILASCYERVL